jgi:hypothetical protein
MKGFWLVAKDILLLTVVTMTIITLPTVIFLGHFYHIF